MELVFNELNTLPQQVDENARNIKTLQDYADGIAKNTADIAQNKSDIAQNKSDIAQNKSDIAQNKSDIARNKADIAQNKSDIRVHTADISQIKSDVRVNTGNIGQNKLDIGDIKVELARQRMDIDGNTIAVSDIISWSSVSFTVGSGVTAKIEIKYNETLRLMAINISDFSTISHGKEILQINTPITYTRTEYRFPGTIVSTLNGSTTRLATELTLKPTRSGLSGASIVLYICNMPLFDTSISGNQGGVSIVLKV